MVEEIHADALEGYKRGLLSQFSEINWGIAKLSGAMQMPGRHLDVRNLDRKLKPDIIFFVRMASQHEEFERDILKKFKPYRLETKTPKSDRKLILLHAKRTIELWETITRALRRHHIILLPGE
ncbi:hypothetical protein MM_2765 [Methanosarcina mazei Go1]|uniref:Uncharacterized protein n=1 Tax=Methanosarcina mazei (strain ATCC BAA-159 / DSM 3647 / Goe1 / Go1 / JCM 11833 / OCM 88) TaxID=192952 RepID=Q8PTF0_METMA|nr:hypothetical protein [Methanosarcina mazei]AAM32461.1 hypothetical protein MM_2765 [Methanosarcina mazei Go1]WIM42697.1 hypothetical protein PSF70_14545 [Methanosarcina mazei]WIM46158.1 hypothetical protein PQQ20_14435 [Methanosarcina mazei]